jgi:hypothetical protein
VRDYRPGSPADLFAVAAFHLVCERSVALVSAGESADGLPVAVLTDAYERSPVNVGGRLRLCDLIWPN